MKQILITILTVLVLAVVGFFGYKYYLSTQSSSLASPSPTSSPTPILTTTPSTSQGVVTGKLCYPSDFLPPGEIVAKDLASSKTYTQAYVGSTAGGGLTYSFKIPTGTYHLRYQAHASLKKPDIFTSGYYTTCAKEPTGTVCTLDSNHISMIVTVKANEETKNVDLCDFYYNPTQMANLDNSF